MKTPWTGVGLRSQHASAVDATPHAVDWYELLADNLLGARGARLARLERLRAERPLALHGVSLSIAGRDPIASPYLDALAALADALDPAFVSDHLCWTGVGGRTSHDLLPVAYTEEVLDHVAARVDAVQERLRRRLFLENASAYVAFRDDSLGEAAFFAALCRRTGCGMLLDVNNLYVNAANLGVDPAAYLATIQPDAVGYLHVAGHAVLEDVRIDTHDAPVPDPVWALYAEAVRRFPEAPVILERDDRIPPFAELVAEAERARELHASAFGEAPVARTATSTRAIEPRSGSAPWASLQESFFARIVDRPLGVEQGDAGALLDEARPVRAARGLRVYTDAYTAGLRRALATNFPALARVLRADDFDALAAAYLRAHPPRGHDFTALGAALAAFLRGFELRASYAVSREALSDLAALEQTQLEAQASDETPDRVEARALASLRPQDWETLRVALAPGVRIVRAAFDVQPAIEAVARGEDPPPPARGETAYLVSRGALGVRTERLDAVDAAVLEALAAGHSFAAACHAADPARGVRALAAACERGIVARLTSGGDAPL